MGAVFFRWILVAGLFTTPSFADSVLVEDPDHVHLAELPSGDVHLKTYRASAAALRDYGQFAKVQDPTTKENPKAPDCTRAEIDVLKRWGTNEIYPTVNKTLRNLKQGKVDGTVVSPRTENLILMVASAVNCAPSYEGRVVRGELTPSAIVAEYLEGNFVLMKAFTSTSKGDEVADTVPWSSKIHIENAVGADIDFLGIATWPGEKEVLIRPGTVFKVLTRTALGTALIPKWDFVFDQH